MRTADELRAMANHTMTFEAEVQYYLDLVHERMRQLAPAAARQGQHQLDVLVLDGKVDQETDTPIAVAWRSLSKEFEDLGYKTRVLPEPLVGLDEIYGYKTHFRIEW